MFIEQGLKQYNRRDVFHRTASLVSLQFYTQILNSSPRTWTLRVRFVFPPAADGDSDNNIHSRASHRHP